MSKSRSIAVMILTLALAGAAYSQKGMFSSKQAPAKQAPASGPAVSGGITGTVVETMNAASYTYALIDTGKGKVWVAGPKTELKVGDKVATPQGMPMQNFESPTLKRTFDVIYFVGEIGTPGHPQAAVQPQGNPHAGLKSKGKSVPSAPLDFTGIKKPEGGLTVAEVFAKKNSLANKKVTVRGKVAKYNAEVMNKNWVHVQDGTGSPGSNDLTITTADTASPGDTVLVTGTLVLNKDFGYGYKYDVLLENAKVTVEQKAKQ